MRTHISNFDRPVFSETYYGGKFSSLVFFLTDWPVCYFDFYQVGFDPPPHMRVPGIPPNLAGIPGGKP